MTPPQNRPQPSFWTAIPLFIFLTLYTLPVHAQSPFYHLTLGLRAGFRSDIHTFASDRSLVKPAFRLNPSTAWFHLTYQWNPRWRLETGLGTTNEFLSLKFPKATNLLIIPSAVIYQSLYLQTHLVRVISLLPHRLFIVPSIGISAAIVSGQGKTYGYFGQNINLQNSDDKLVVYYESIDPKGTYLSLGFKTRLPLELHFRSGIRLSFSPGFSVHPLHLGQPVQNKLSYGLNGQLTHTSKVSLTSYSTEFVIGLDYPISRIWEGKKDLIP